MKFKAAPPLLLFLAAGLAAQQPPPPSPEKPPEECVLEGQVVKAGSGEPLKKARVVLRRAEGREQPYSTLADAAGRFVLNDVEPGRYRLLAGRNGYVRQEYGQRQPNSPGTILTLAPGQRLRDLVFKLIPAAVIAGRVYDEDGEPVPGARMEALQYRYMENRRQLAPMRVATTNDRGEYRLYGLPPGRYYISASYSPSMAWGMMGLWVGSGEAARDTAGEEGYAPTYYPGTNDPARATAMEVRQGDEVGGVDILLLATRAVRVRGHVVNTVTGKPIRDAMIHLFPRGTGVRVFSFENRATVDPEKGTFEIVRVTPGSYTLWAEWYDEEGKEDYRTRIPLEVGSSNIEGIEVVFGRGVELAGTIELEVPPRLAADSTTSTSAAVPPDATLDFDELQVGLSAQEDYPFGGEYARVKGDGSFQLKNLSVCDYKVEVTQRGGLPGDYYLKSARLAGNDILEEGLTVGGPVRGALELVLSPAGGHIEGTVLTAEGKPFSGARVVLVPEERRRQRTDLFKSTTTDQYGRFTLRGLTPGEYKLFAWEDVEPGAYQDSEFLRPYEDKGKEVRIREGDRLEAELALIPAEGVRQE